jgi:hypothetical protein
MTDFQAQLFTVPPYAVALVFMLLLTSFSDYKQSRGIPIMSVFLIGIVGWAILLSVPVSFLGAWGSTSFALSNRIPLTRLRRAGPGWGQRDWIENRADF